MTERRAGDWAADDLPLIGEPFAVELANSDYRTSGMDFLADDLINVWFAHVSGPNYISRNLSIPPGAAASVRAVRDATRLLLGRIADDLPLGQASAAMDVLNAAARQAPARAVLEFDDAARPVWALHHNGQAADVLVAQVASRCILFVGNEEATCVRRCARPQCPMFFVQHHRARRYCHESCAHRVRQSRYYQRTRA